MLFATPDFGASGLVVLILFGISLAVLIGTIFGVVRCVIILRRPSPARRWPGVVLILASLLTPACCYSTPSVLFRLNHDTPPLGWYPSGVIKDGMSADQVRALLGEPHEVNDRNPKWVRWTYWTDAIELNGFMVSFGPDGRVEYTQTI